MQKIILNFLIIVASLYFIPTTRLSNETILIIALASVIGFLLLDRLMGYRLENFIPPSESENEPVCTAILKSDYIYDGMSQQKTIPTGPKIDISNLEFKLKTFTISKDCTVQFTSENGSTISIYNSKKVINSINSFSNKGEYDIYDLFKNIKNIKHIQDEKNESAFTAILESEPDPTLDGMTSQISIQSGPKMDIDLTKFKLKTFNVPTGCTLQFISRDDSTISFSKGTYDIDTLFKNIKYIQVGINKKLKSTIERDIINVLQNIIDTNPGVSKPSAKVALETFYIHARRNPDMYDLSLFSSEEDKEYLDSLFIDTINGYLVNSEFLNTKHIEMIDGEYKLIEKVVEPSK